MRIMILIIPTQPRAKSGNFSPTIIPPAAIAARSITTPANSICLELAWFRTGPLRHKMSSKAMITRLKMQLPNSVPKPKSGSPMSAAELTPVTASGIEVIIARSTRPTHILPKPVFSAIASPYRASFVPENRMITTHRINLNQTTD